MMAEISQADVVLLRRTFELAVEARAAGDHPFGALLADSNGEVVLQARNTVNSERDVTAHAERNLIALASIELEDRELSSYTIYASTEPCPMCAGAVYWGGVGRVVYGLSQRGLYALSAADPTESFLLSCRQVLEAGGRPVQVEGPYLEAEARRPHEGFWGSGSSAEKIG